MIQAILFDFNGVLTTSPFDHMAQLADASGGGGPAMLELIIGPYHEDTDHAWHRFERGEITAEEYFTDLTVRADAAGVTLAYERLGQVMERMQIHEPVVDRVRLLRADGYRTALVTNNVKEASDRWRPLLPLAELFDAVVDSSECGMRKPNPAIFRHALELLGGVPADAAVFLDDLESNVEGARRAGLHGIVVDAADPSGALAELDALLSAP